MTTPTRPTAVLKLGGSLLTFPNLVPALRRVQRDLAAYQILLVLGGGAVADAIREWNRIHSLPEQRSHWMAIQALTFNAQLLEALCPDLRVIDSRAAAAQHWQEHQIAILNCGAYVRHEEPRQRLQLPHHWDATSDSVAGWVAITWPADRFILLKSTDWPEGTTLAGASQAGLVDPQLPLWTSDLPRPAWVNLRREPLAVHELS